MARSPGSALMSTPRHPDAVNHRTSSREQCSADADTTGTGFDVTRVDDAESGLPHFVEPPRRHAHHRVVDGSDDRRAPGVGQESVEAARPEQGFGDQARLAPHEQGAAPRRLELFEGLAAQVATALAVLALCRSRALHGTSSIPFSEPLGRHVVPTGEQLLDPVENGAPLPMGGLVGAHLFELGRRQPLEPLHHL